MSASVGFQSEASLTLPRSLRKVKLRSKSTPSLSAVPSASVTVLRKLCVLPVYHSDFGPETAGFWSGLASAVTGSARTTAAMKATAKATNLLWLCFTCVPPCKVRL